MMRSEMERLAVLVDEKLRDLGEHFEAVQIFGTFVDDGGQTVGVTRGIGNWYARQGLAREFLDMDAAATTANELSKVICIDEEGGF